MMKFVALWALSDVENHLCTGLFFVNFVGIVCTGLFFVNFVGIVYTGLFFVNFVGIVYVYVILLFCFYLPFG